jgi:hypothetical protein
VLVLARPACLLACLLTYFYSASILVAYMFTVYSGGQDKADMLETT